MSFHEKVHKSYRFCNDQCASFSEIDATSKPQQIAQQIFEQIMSDRNLNDRSGGQ